MNDSSLTDLLRLSARVHASAADHGQLRQATARFTRWPQLAETADRHGLVPLLFFHLTQAGIPMPADTRLRIFALAVQHRRANDARFRLLGKVLDALDHADVPVLVLKGAALAHMLYPSADLRPMTDIDLLVPPRLAARAQSVLEALGLVPLSAGHAGGDHHHLPALRTMHDGCMVQVEIHCDAIARDTSGSLSFETLSGAPQAFSIEGRKAWTLCHADMLYHLCRHAVERARLLRLIWIADAVGYAARFRDEIPWTDLRLRHPFVLNALSLMHLVTALPRELRAHVTPARGDGLTGLGAACLPLSEILRRGRPLRDIARDVIDPSDWWLRVYYGVDEDTSLWWHRSIVHPRHVASWLWRRGLRAVRRRTRLLAGVPPSSRSLEISAPAETVAHDDGT